MGKNFDLASLAKEKPFQPPAFTGNGHAAPAVRSVRTGAVVANPLNKRRAEDETDLAELAETVREHGLIQPLVVCTAAAYLSEFPAQRDAVGGAEWVALIGNRRLRGAELASLAEVPIVVNDDRVTSMYEVMLVENGQRLDLPPALEAEAMVQVLEREGITRTELARRIGKSNGYITQRTTLLKLIPELRRALDAGELKLDLARQVGEFSAERQEEIVANGKPYRIPNAKPSPRRINAASPEAAAESIRKAFTPEELTRLVELLTQQNASSP